MLPLNQVCQDLQIRQQEIGARKQIANNPVQMESIKAQVGFNAAAVHVLMVLHALPQYMLVQAKCCILWLCVKVKAVASGPGC